MDLSDFDRGWLPSSLPLRRVVGSLAVVLALATIALLASWLNHRRFFLVVEPERVRVDRGAWLPIGHRPFNPDTSRLSTAYAAFRLPSGFPTAVGTRVFTDRVELDQDLYRLLVDAARFALSSAPGGSARPPRDVDLAADLLEQIEHLPGLTPRQRREVRSLERGLAYHLGRRALRAARAELGRAQTWLFSASKDPEIPDDAFTEGRRAQRALELLEGPRDAEASRDSRSGPAPEHEAATTTQSSSVAP
jgi:hypothetical protein